MSTLDAVLEKFDASKAKVRKEIREGFFKEDGTLAISESDLRTWIADRAVDELKVVFQLSAVIANCAHLIPAHVLVQVAEQMSDEARHFDILRGLVPQGQHSYIDAKVKELPAALATDAHWASLMSAALQGNPFAALIDINIVHEGYSAAAIEELTNIPFDDIREAYRGIGADEEKHHESGRDLLLWLTGAADIAAVTMVPGDERAADGGAMSWSWPAANPTTVLAGAEDRAGAGQSTSWSWPAAVPIANTAEIVAGASDRAVEGGAMSWSWPVPATSTEPSTKA